ncbi:hypothetical protein ACW9HR_35430 [Nocardia gipuzkoensis]
MNITTSSKRAAWGVGAVTGMVGIGNVVLAFRQQGSVSGALLGVLLLFIILILITGMLTTLALVLEYLEGRPYRELLLEAARRPEHSDALAQIIDADSRHEAIKSGRSLIDREQRQLYRPNTARSATGSERRYGSDHRHRREGLAEASISPPEPIHRLTNPSL